MQKNIRRKDGTWKHYYKRHIGTPEEVEDFVGWDKLLSIIHACDSIKYDVYWKEYCIERDKALIATLFETGGRIGEVLSLERSNFDFNHGKYALVTGMLLSKRFEKTGNYTEKVYKEPTGAHARLYEADTEKIEGKIVQVWTRKRWRTTITSEKALKLRVRRPFPIFKSEPLYNIMETWIRRNHGSLLFPSPKTRKNGSREMTESNAWVIIHRLQKITNIEMFPHWFRSQRASQLYHDYGLTWEELKMWFNWVSEKMAELYTRTSGESLADRMLHRMKVKATTHVKTKHKSTMN